MIIKIKKEIAEVIGLQKFSQFGINKDSWGWKNLTELNLARISEKKVKALASLLENSTEHGVGVLRKDIATWLRAIHDASMVRPRNCKQFSSLLKRLIAAVPGHRIYKRHCDSQWLGYYVNDIEYHPAYTSSGGHYNPANTDMEVIWEEFGGKHKKSYVFLESDCRSMTLQEALARMGFVCETEELRAAYLKDVERFAVVTKEIGKQFWCSGTAVDDLDGNPSRDNSWWHSREHTYQMVRNGQPTRTVVDVFYEDAKTKRDEDDKVKPNVWFWSNEANVAGDEGEENEDDKKLDDEDKEDVEEIPVVEIPVHPLLAIFDLSKHLRMRTHVNNLAPYEYDKNLFHKLIIPDELRSLVHILIEHKDGGFQDIVRGKSGGAVVMLCGRPGTGKTLTAEVYAESEGRALYSIQCSQLGTDPETLEDELLKVFARAARWNAVTLLDEADVYVRSRGQDLNQNAIVGVFLRVLEYQSSILFLTTNRPDDVDDAVASRCIAKIEYQAPTAKNQALIWRVLAGSAGIQITEETIKEIVAKNPGLSGRDVKNLLKLAALMRPGESVKADTVEFVKRFKPTGTEKTPDLFG